MIVDGINKVGNAIDQKKAQLAAELAANQKRQQEIDAQLAASKAAQDQAAADYFRSSNGVCPDVVRLRLI